MITNRNAKLAVIHLARKDLGLHDDDYRALIEGAAGITSCKYLQTEQQFSAIMKAFERAGYKPKRRKNNRPAWQDRWGCSDALRAKIEAMWRSVSRQKTDRSLKAFIKRIAHVDSPAWLNNYLAAKVIQALGVMFKKEGLDFNTGERINDG